MKEIRSHRRFHAGTPVIARRLGPFSQIVARSDARVHRDHLGDAKNRPLIARLGFDLPGFQRRSDHGEQGELYP
jgi:hypothetical protein